MTGLEVRDLTVRTSGGRTLLDSVSWEVEAEIPNSSMSSGRPGR